MEDKFGKVKLAVLQTVSKNVNTDIVLFSQKLVTNMSALSCCSMVTPHTHLWREWGTVGYFCQASIHLCSGILCYINCKYTLWTKT